MNKYNKLIDFMLKYQDVFNPHISNLYPFTNEQIEEYKDKIIWVFNFESVAIFSLSENININWSIELLNKYIDKWDWDTISTFIIGKKLWSKNIIEIYEKYIDWNSLSGNPNIVIDNEFLVKYADKLNWDSLINNEAFYWNTDMIELYKNYINYDNVFESWNAPWNKRFEIKRHIVPRKLSLDDCIDLIYKYEESINFRFFEFEWWTGLPREDSDYILSNFYNYYKKKEFVAKKDPSFTLF